MQLPVMRKKEANRVSIMTLNLQRLLCAGLWLTLAILPARSQTKLTPEQIYKKLLPSVMMLEVERQPGTKFFSTAFIVLEDDVALTAWHSVVGASSVWAFFANGEKVKATGCIDYDVVRDLALIKLDKPMPHRRAALCSDLQSVGALAYVIGAPRSYDFSICDGLISQIRRVDGFPQYQVSCPISPGNSGGPVLNECGEVVGIVSWTKTDAQNVSFAIPAGELRRLSASSRPLSWKQLAAKVHPAPPTREVESHTINRKLPVENVAAGNLIDFKKRLSQSAGKPVTVTVQDDGATSTYSFTVPRHGLN